MAQQPVFLPEKQPYCKAFTILKYADLEYSVILSELVCDLKDKLFSLLPAEAGICYGLAVYIFTDLL